jgi:hypothetical protein
MPDIGRINYENIMSTRDGRTGEILIAWLWNELVNVFRDSYLEMTPRKTEIVRITQGAFEYLYDDYSSLETQGLVPYHPTMEARIVAAMGRSTPREPKRDDGRLRNWSGNTLQPGYGSGWDRGHFIAYSMGGVVDGFELNVFVQRRSLNRGWKTHPAGRRYRNMERYCAASNGTFCFSRPIYDDETSKPTFIEFGILKPDSELWTECFDNR